MAIAEGSAKVAMAEATAPPADGGWCSFNRREFKQREGKPCQRVDGYPMTHPWDVSGIFTDMNLNGWIFLGNVGTYTSPMDPMGMI